MMDFLVAKKFQESTQLSDAHPINQIDMLRECWFGFAGKCGRDDFFYASISRRIGEQPGIHAVTGDDSQDVWRDHAGNLAE